MWASVGSGSRVEKVTIPTVEITGLTEEVPVKVQPPVPKLNGVGTTTVPPVPFVPPVAPPPTLAAPPDPALGPQPSPLQNRAPHQSKVVAVLFICRPRPPTAA